MMLRMLGAAATLAVAATSTAQTPAPPPARILAMRFSPAPQALAVRVRTTLPASGRLSVAVPATWARAQHLERNITDLQAERPAALDRTDPLVPVIAGAPGSTVTYSYVVHDDPQETLQYNVERPVIRDGYAALLGNNALVLPREAGSAPYDVTLDFTALPKPWSVATSFGTARTQRFTETVDELRHGLVVLGDYRLVTRSAGANPVTVAVRGGTFGFTDAEFADFVARIVRAERAFWDDPGPPYFLVTVTPLRPIPRGTSRGGEGRTNAFALYLPAEQKLDRTISVLVAHEMFHTWNPRRFGDLAPPESHLYWLSEGFTDYYALALLDRSGLFTHAQTLEQLNEWVGRYAANPEKNVPNDAAADRFFSGGWVYELTYRRGLLLGLRWDAALRASGSSLDALVRALAADRAARGGAPLTPADVRRVVAAVLGPAGGEDIDRYVTRGDTIPLTPNPLGLCAALRSRPDPTNASRDLPFYESCPGTS